MPHPEVRLQRAALTLAEDLNFTRAAERLGITQSALSKQIADLEDALGFAVFSRDRKRVSLTEAGHVFIRGCLEAEATLERAVRLARTSHDTVRPHLSIGHSPYAEPALVSMILGMHLPLHPDLRLRVESMFAQELAHSVLAAELDLAIVSDPPSSSGLTLVKISTLPLCVVMPIDHPAAQKGFVGVDDFGDVGWMIFSRRAHPVIYERILEAGRQAAITPVELHHYVSPQDAVRLVAQNFGIAFMAKGIAEQLRDRDIAVRPLSVPSLQVTTYLALRAQQSSRLANDFARTFLRRVIPRATELSAPSQLQLAL